MYKQIFIIDSHNNNIKKLMLEYTLKTIYIYIFTYDQIVIKVSLWIDLKYFESSCLISPTLQKKERLEETLAKNNMHNFIVFFSLKKILAKRQYYFNATFFLLKYTYSFIAALKIKCLNLHHNIHPVTLSFQKISEYRKKSVIPDFHFIRDLIYPTLAYISDVNLSE